MYKINLLHNEHYHTFHIEHNKTVVFCQLNSLYDNMFNYTKSAKNHILSYKNQEMLNMYKNHIILPMCNIQISDNIVMNIENLILLQSNTNFKFYTPDYTIILTENTNDIFFGPLKDKHIMIQDDIVNIISNIDIPAIKPARIPIIKITEIKQLNNLLTNIINKYPLLFNLIEHIEQQIINTIIFEQIYNTSDSDLIYIDSSEDDNSEDDLIM